MQKSNINPALYQQFLESAANAGEKGQAAFFTPFEWAEVLSIPLPRYRPVVIDLNCGAGNLLKGASRGSTNHRLGCDIDPCDGAPTVSYSGQVNGIQRITANVCKLLPFLKAVRFAADCWVLNPPWDLHWYRQFLNLLLESDLPTVRAAIAAHDGRTGKDTIDSTIATMCLALDLSSDFGEGLLIGNENTFQRLIFSDGAPHRSLSQHVWAHLVIKGNPMTGLQDCDHQQGEQFTTGVLYFSRGHDAGPPDEGSTLYRPPVVATLAEAKLACEELQKHRRELNTGRECGSSCHTVDSHEKWKAVGEEWERLNRKDRPQWNITLSSDGTIKTDLSLYDVASCRMTKDEAESLFALGGQHPMQLVMQRQQRAHLEKAAFGKTWRVDPKVQEAVRSAVADYHRVRAPLYPLTPIQRLGYLDESDYICCSKDLGCCFKADHAYPLRSCTIAVKRSGEKLNLCGELDSVEWDSSELAFYVKDESGVEKVFMEGRLRADNIKLSILNPGEKPSKQDHEYAERCSIDFDLQELVSHFIIPDVPDVAKVNPEGYRKNLALLDEIEACALNGFKFRRFQKEDLARAALHDGLVLGLDTGTGKTICGFTWPLLKVGRLPKLPLCPAEPVLFIAAGDLHEQIIEEGCKHFGIQLTILDSQETFLRLSSVSPTGRRTLPPGFYLSTYTEISRNGVAAFPELDLSNPGRMLKVLNLSEKDVEEFFAGRFERYQKHYLRLGAIPTDSAAQLKAKWFRERKDANEYARQDLDESFYIIQNFAPERAGLCNPEPGDLRPEQIVQVRALFVEMAHKALSFNNGESRYKSKIDREIKCVYSPTLADLCCDTFACVVADEGVKLKGEDTLVGRGVRQLNPKYRLILTATPVKNRFPDVFRLAWWAVGAHHMAHPRFPFGDDDLETFSDEFLVTERNLSAEERSESGKRFVKKTAQVANIHRAWKLFAPIILRRRKADCGEDLVKMTRHVVRVPMGTAQAAVYKFHLEAEYTDKNGKPALGAKLQALRVAAADPTSPLLRNPESTTYAGN